ncbi:MAG: hypothetical protein M1820_002128 [Bogoriella megaspora]|nr:MAG: hypothetical protein M1820_002128 [Bogoriella megaspora]
MASNSTEEGLFNKPATLPVPNSTESFWHSEPSQLLLNHRTTSDLPDKADVVIIGSGITGTSAAHHLATQSKLGIVLLEAREACWGATGRNGGHCQPLLYDRPVEVGRFELNTYNIIKEMMTNQNAEDGTPISCEYHAQPGCRAFYEEKLMDAAEEDVAALKNEAPDLGELVRVVRDPKELAKLRLSEAVGAIVSQPASRLWPYKLVCGLLEPLVREQKINLQTNTPVTGLKALVEDTSGDGKYHWVLATDRGSIKARHVILATNAYTSHLLPSFSDLIVPCRGQMSALIPPASSRRLETSFGFIGIRTGNAQKGDPKQGNPNHDDYLIQRSSERTIDGVEGRRHLMFGGGGGAGNIPFLGSCDDSVVDPDVARYLRSTLLQALTLEERESVQSSAELVAAREWTGVMGYSRDNLPFVGSIPSDYCPGGKGSLRSSCSNLWIAAGYTGHGMPNGLLCGRAVVDMILTVGQGKSVWEASDGVVENGYRLPRSYLVTDQRIRRARKLPTVAQADEMGWMGFGQQYGPADPSLKL